MKILMVSHEYPPIGGGGANACMHLAKEYAVAGNEVHIVTAWFPGEKEYWEEKYDNRGVVKVQRLKSKRKHEEHCSFSEMLDFVFKAIPVTSRLEAAEHYDICQIFFGIPSGVVGYLLKKRYKLPYVIRFGGGDIPGFQDRFTTVYKLIAPAIKIIWKKADALVANSLGLKKLAQDFYDKKEIKIIPNGADVNAFSGDASSGDTGKLHGQMDTDSDNATLRLLFVSRLIERKGLQDVLPQLRTVADSLADGNVSENASMNVGIHLDIVGDGPYREILEQIVSEHGISDLVTFHGQKNKAQLPEYYSQADVFLFPSRKEGMPNAVLEAMSYGLPIIMTPCQGSDELIDGNGYVTQASDFSNKIIELAENGELRNRMGEKSKELITNVFSWKATAGGYLRLFKDIVG